MEKNFFLPTQQEKFSELSITSLARFSAIRGSLTCMVQAPFSLGTFSIIRGQPYFLSHVQATMSSGRRPTTRARSGPQAGEDAAASLGPNQTSQGPSENNNGGTSATVSTTGSGPPQWFTAAISGLRSEIAETRSVASQAVEATASLTTTVGQLKKKKTVDRPAPAVLKKPDLARQHAFNERVLTSVDAALESLPDDAEEVRSILLQSKSDLDTRQKHIRIADKFDWETVEVYADGLVGDNCEDDRRIASAASLARRLARGSQDDPPAVSKHHRSFRNFASPPVHRHTSSATPLPDPRCYLFGETGHFARQCHLLWSSQQRQRDRLASSASPWPSRNQWRPSTPAPHRQPALPWLPERTASSRHAGGRRGD